MSDEADRADQESAAFIDAHLGNVRLAAQNIPVGEPGECNRCGEHFTRLVGGACGRCRDKFKLP